MNEVCAVAVPSGCPPSSQLTRLGRKLKIPGRGVSASADGQEAGERTVALSLGVGLVGRPAASAPCPGPEGLLHRVQGAPLPPSAGRRVSLWPYFIKLPPPNARAQALPLPPPVPALGSTHPTPYCVFVHPCGFKYQFYAGNFTDL